MVIITVYRDNVNRVQWKSLRLTAYLWKSGMSPKK